MTGALAQILGDAFAVPGQAIASTAAEPQEGRVLLALADRVAGALRAGDVAAGEPVHVRFANRPSDLGSLLGVWRAGAVAVPFHAAAAPSTLERLQRLTAARFLVDGGEVAVLAPRPPPERPLLRDAALVCFTSGSTGEPKGVVVGHRRLADKLAVLDRLLGVGPADVVLSPLQLTFIFGLWVSLLAIQKRARLVLVPKFSRDALAGGLATATVVAGVPSMFRTLLAQGAAGAPSAPCAPSAPKLRLILTGGEVLAPKLADALRRFAPAAIVDLYGSTETGSCDFCLGSADQPHGFGTIGNPTGRVAFRIARDGGTVAAGEPGELQIRTPFGMLGYLDAPEATAAAFDDGYFRTGDLARLTERGHVALIGRAKDIVSRGGTKIAPLEIDNLLCEHPDVAAALCCGVPDERLGEVIHAVVVARAGICLDDASLRAWMLARTERYKVPEVFYFRDALPTGATGKAERTAVARLGAAAGAEPTA